ncbi:tetratricopeptide repeat protein [Sandarakinorhabdus sp.]|uniref:tetratricopeptide repeat protein n=1 Tax=Sandarakinorhabdus sp. TaxID=1916663 RepID=UPI00286EB2B5|nr:hypothetical protein [Sandarakinorhabdus sp.]
MPLPARSLSARFIIAAAVVALAAPASAAVSPAVGKALTAASKAAASGNTGAAIAAIGQAQNAASTAEEKLKTSQMAGYVYTRAGRYGEAAGALAAAGAPARQLAPLYYRAGQYDKAIALAKQSGGEDMQILIAQAYTRTGRAGLAVNAYNSLIKSNGPKPQYLENLAGAQYKAGDKKAYLATTQRLIKVDSSPARWRTLLTNFQGNNMRGEARLALYHLMMATGTLDRPQDYQDFAKLALVSGQAGLAGPALAKAGAASDAMSQKLAQAAVGMTAKAAADAPRLSADPKTAVRGGNSWLGLGQYGKAVAAYDVAIKAAGPDADQAMLWKGIASLRSGNAAAARASFAGIPEKSGMHDIANLWALFAQTRGAIAG